MPPRELFCPACGRPMELRTNGKSGEKFYGCTGFHSGCTGIIPAYPDGGVRDFAPRQPKVERKMLELKRQGAERIDRARRAGRIDAATHIYFDMLLADADNLVELGEAQAIVRKGT